MAKKVFFSFHFDNDCMRTQQVRNIGALEGNKPVAAQRWEEVKRSGKTAIEKWIDDNMKDKSAVVVLIGSDTANRPWVQHEIVKAWNDGKGLLGIHIHNIKCARNGTCRKGPNPFDQFKLDNGQILSSIVKCHEPNPFNAYHDIAENIESWIDNAIRARK